MRAFQSKIIQAEDELDHLGLYLKHNIYTKYAEELSANGERKVQWHGYRSDIDKFFAEKLYDSEAECLLMQDMPTHLKNIINVLSKSNVPGRRKATSILLDCGGQDRDNITSGIDTALSQQSRTKRPLPLSTYGGTKITLFCWQAGILDRNYDFAQHHTKVAMTVAGEDGRLLLELIYDKNNTLVDVRPAFITLEGLSPDKLQNIRVEAETLRKSRINKAIRLRGKIGRNELCPCGSGKKYKNCCLNMN